MTPDYLPKHQDHFIWQEEDIFPNCQVDCVHAVSAHHTMVGMHRHSFYEISILLQGEGRHYIEDRIYPAKRGCVFTVPPNIRHGYYSEQGIILYNFLLSRTFFDRYREEIHCLPGSSVLFEATSKNPVNSCKTTPNMI